MFEQFIGFGVLFLMVMGSFKFTYDKTKIMADKTDIKNLTERIDAVYKLLIEMEKKSNGIPRNSN